MTICFVDKGKYYLQDEIDRLVFLKNNSMFFKFDEGIIIIYLLQSDTFFEATIPLHCLLSVF